MTNKCQAARDTLVKQLQGGCKSQSIFIRTLERCCKILNVRKTNPSSFEVWVKIRHSLQARATGEILLLSSQLKESILNAFSFGISYFHTEKKLSSSHTHSFSPRSVKLQSLLAEGSSYWHTWLDSEHIFRYTFGLKAFKFLLSSVDLLRHVFHLSRITL